MRNLGQYKVKAGALQFTIFISVLIALILTAFFLLNHIHQTFGKQGNLVKETIHLADEGIVWARGGETKLGIYEIPYPGLRDFQFLTVDSKYWGAFQWVKSKAKSKAYSFEKNALLGGAEYQQEHFALIMSNTFSPLVIVGQTHIVGDVQISEKGIKAGNMGGSFFQGEQLVKGKIKHRNGTIPQLPKDFEINLKNWIYDRFPNKADEVFWKQPKAFHNSFTQKTSWLYSKQPIYLDDEKYTGNLIIKSEKKISVSPLTQLDKVILIAPEIEIQNGFHGNLQAFATENILLQPNTRLNYPSVLVLYPKMNSEKIGNKENSIRQIKLVKNARLKGCVFYLGEYTNQNLEAEIFLDNNSQIVGEIYNTQSTELKGSIAGSVYTKSFVAHEFGSVYRNHIYNGNINARELHEKYAGILLKGKRKDVAQWLF